eukprot:SAG31_NODE_10547_length_1126_cov_1.168452_1_plen_283_part_00
MSHLSSYDRGMLMRYKEEAMKIERAKKERARARNYAGRQLPVLATDASSVAGRVASAGSSRRTLVAPSAVAAPSAPANPVFNPAARVARWKEISRTDSTDRYRSSYASAGSHQARNVSASSTASSTASLYGGNAHVGSGSTTNSSYGSGGMTGYRDPYSSTYTPTGTPSRTTADSRYCSPIRPLSSSHRNRPPSASRLSRPSSRGELASVIASFSSRASSPAPVSSPPTLSPSPSPSPAPVASGSIRVVCDACDGPHPTDKCPHCKSCAAAARDCKVSLFQY